MGTHVSPFLSPSPPPFLLLFCLSFKSDSDIINCHHLRYFQCKRGCWFPWHSLKKMLGRWQDILPTQRVDQYFYAVLMKYHNISIITRGGRALENIDKGKNLHFSEPTGDSSKNSPEHLQQGICHSRLLSLWLFHFLDSQRSPLILRSICSPPLTLIHSAQL